MTPAINATATLALILSLSACGVADSGATAAASAKLKTEEVQRTEIVKKDLEQQLDVARQQTDEHRKELEAATRQ